MQHQNFIVNNKLITEFLHLDGFNKLGIKVYVSNQKRSKGRHDLVTVTNNIELAFETINPLTINYQQ